MKKVFYWLMGAVVLMSAYSCADDTTIGSSISETTINIIQDSSFKVTGRSARIERVQSRTMTQLLGKLTIKNYGTLQSDVVTQFMPIQALDTAGVTPATVDSINFYMRTYANTGFTGDSLAPMKASVYFVNKQLPSPIFNDFDPASYYDKDDLIGEVAYSASDLSKMEAERRSHFYSDGQGGKIEIREIKIPLPRTFGQALVEEYRDFPASFHTPEAFAEFFPGIYVKSTHGSGRVMNFFDTEVEMFFRRKVTADSLARDSIAILASAPEVITNNILKLDVDPALERRVNAGEAILQAPLGYEVKIKFPMVEILNNFMADSKNGLVSMNSVSLEIPAEEIENDCNLTPPTYLLLIREKDKDDFFKEGRLNDDLTSYYAKYDETKKSYTFPSLRNYFSTAWADEEAEWPSYSDMVLVPIDVTLYTSSNSSYYYYNTSTTSTVTKMQPLVSRPTMARLLLDKAKVKLTYSKQSMIFE